MTDAEKIAELEAENASLRDHLSIATQRIADLAAANAEIAKHVVESTRRTLAAERPAPVVLKPPTPRQGAFGGQRTAPSGLPPRDPEAEFSGSGEGA